MVTDSRLVDQDVQRTISGEGRRDGARLAPLALFALGLLIFSSGLGLRDPWPADEPRFALIARDMVESGEWFFPHRAAELYAHKPPLFMWAIAVGYAATGSLRLAFLLPSLVAGLLVLALVYDLGRRLWHRRAGLGAGLALLTIVQFPLQAKTAQIDASVTFWTTLGLYGLCRHLFLGPSWRWWSLAWFAMGVGIITKGVGFLPLLALLPWAVARVGGWSGPVAVERGGWRWLLGPLGLLVGVGLWVVPMWVLVSESGSADLAAYRHEILWGQTAERYTSFEGHQKSPWYYFTEAIPILWLPASLLLPWLIPAWWRRLKRRDGRYLFLLGWILLVVLFFSFGSGKRGVYITPAVPALALACGPLVAAGLHRLRGVGPVAFGLLALLTGVFLTAGFGGVAGASWAEKAVAGSNLEPWYFVLALGVVGLFWAVRFRPAGGLPALTAFLASVWFLYGWWGYPLLDPVRSGAVLMEEVEEQLAPGSELAILAWREQMVLHAQRPITHWGYAHREWDLTSGAQMLEASSWLNEGEGRFALVPQAWLDPCFTAEGAVSLGTWSGFTWMLTESMETAESCAGQEGEWAAVPVRRYRSLGPPDGTDREHR